MSSSLSSSQTLESIYHQLRDADQNTFLQHCENEAPQALMKSSKKNGLRYYRGKVRELFSNRKKVYIWHSDRLSAFDRHICCVPYKGLILNEINCFWLKKAADIMATHYLDKPHSRVLLAVKTQPIKIEVVVRAYLAGSMLRDYLKGQRQFSDHLLPDGLKAYSKLPSPIVTPTTKAEVYQHDAPISPSEIVRQGFCTEAQWQQITTKSLELFSLGQNIFAEHGWLLVDTKYEFGLTLSGDLLLIDEIHTPDSSRLWAEGSYHECISSGSAPEMFDKENIRRFLASKGFIGEGDIPLIPNALILDLAETYLKVAETLLGKKIFILKDEVPFSFENFAPIC